MSDKSSIKYILSLSIPIFFANLAIPLVGIVDTALMGNMSNQGYLTATSIASSFFSLVFWSFGFLRMGTVGLVSQSFGRNDYKSILNIVFRNLLFVISILKENRSLDISELATLIKDSSFVVANDTGPAHIAAHLNSNGLALFGSHTTAYKVSIERENFKAIQVTDLNKLSPEKVFEYFIKSLN